MTTFNTPFGELTLNVPIWKGNKEVVDEVINEDCYRLGALKQDGVDLRYVIDVGAHIGTFAALVRLGWPNAKLLCFEPDPETAKVCSGNVPGANVVTAAVRYDNRNELFVSEYKSGSMIYDPTVNFDDDIPNKYRRVKVPTMTLDSYITSQVDLLKLDCEGSEIDILSSLPRKCIPHVKRIVGEYHHISGYRFIEQIINMRFPHLHPMCWENDQNKTIGMFAAA